MASKIKVDQIDTTLGSGNVTIDPDNNTLVVDTDNSRVGIGTASPNLALQISAPSATVGIDDTTTSIPMLRFRDNGTTIGRIYMTGGDMRFDTNGTTERLRILSSGGLTFNGDTAAANALDDYEEGTFTAQFNAVTKTMTDTTGKYVKIGKMVFIQAKMTVSSIDNTDTSGIQFTLPFSSEGSTGACFFTYDSSSTTLFDGNHDKVHGARMTSDTCVITENDGTDARYLDVCQTSGTFRFALSYETT